MSEELAGDTGTDNGSTLDIDATVADLAADLGLGGASDDDTDEAVDPPEEPPVAPASAQEARISAAPKSWPQEMHPHWAKVPKEVQDYWTVREKQMLDGLEQYKQDAGYGRRLAESIAPYRATIQSLGIDEPTAVRTLLNADYKLRTGSPSQKLEYFQSLAKQYGVDVAGLGAPAEGVGTQDPAIRSLMDEIHGIKTSISQAHDAQVSASRASIEKEVNAFASDPSHPYFDEVADDIVAQLKAGASLKDAYEKAVWANPVTRAKEIARLNTEQEANLKKRLKEEAEAARKATSTNVRSRDTRRTPTEPKGTMEDTMRETLAGIKSRAAH